jgi:trehalose 6-phosphate synthase/phosphatase
MQLLEQLATIPGTEVAVVSGRALAVLRGLLIAEAPDGSADRAADGPADGVDRADILGHLHLIGSHGAETHGDTGQRLTEEEARRLARLRLELQQITAEYPAVRLETKPTGVAVHLRGLDEADTAAVTAAVEENPATWSGVHLLRGKRVLELTVVTTDKGRAVRRLSAAEHISATVYIGDDVTDENAFGVLTAPDLGIKVGAGRTAADVRVADPDRVTDVLRVLAGARQRAAGRRSGQDPEEAD